MRCNQQELAEVFGISVRTIQRWEVHGLANARVSDEATRAMYDLTAAVAWRVDREVERFTELSTNGASVDFEEARARKEMALARLREFDLAERQQTLIHVDDAGDSYAEIIAEIAAAIRSAPARYAHHVLCTCRDAATALEVLDKVFDNFRAQLRDGDPKPDAAAS